VYVSEGRTCDLRIFILLREMMNLVQPEVYNLRIMQNIFDIENGISTLGVTLFVCIEN